MSENENVRALLYTDVLIIGSGCAGLIAALHLPSDKKITIITKRNVERSDSFLAQGGMCMLDDMSDYDAYFEDTLKAGHYENDKTSVDLMIRNSKDLAEELLGYGVRFTRNPDGSLDFTREGGHSRPRILFYKDITGREITEKLWNEANKRPNISIVEYRKMVDLLIKDNVCYGAVVKDNSERAVGKAKDLGRSFDNVRTESDLVENAEALKGLSGDPDNQNAEKEINGFTREVTYVMADYTILATGGIGGLYGQSTNFRNLTGDSLAMALKYGIEVRDINYIQIHPTTFYTTEEEDRNFLISESVRGEGALLLDKNGERFVDELLPRDVLTGKILEQMKKDGTEHVWEDLRPIPEEELRTHFPNIVQHCLEKGYDVTKEPIPVVPAQHYYMGGIKVDYRSATSCERLYAVGETACNGVHGKNRLASNSLLESMVFARLAANDISENYEKNTFDDSTFSENTLPDEAQYLDGEALDNLYRSSVREAIAKADNRIYKKDEE